MEKEIEELIAQWTKQLEGIDLDAAEGVPEPIAWAHAKTLDDCITDLKKLIKKD